MPPRARQAPYHSQANPDVERLYRAGLLEELKLQPHQFESFDAFVDWNADRQTPEHQRWVGEIGALYDNLWLDEWGRRGGKTAKWLLLDYCEAVRRPGSRGIIATPLRKSIGGIIVPLTKLLFRDAPEGYFPHYKGTNGADHECLYIEATDSTITLVGLDKNPDATRGQWLDFAHITEAAFVKGLHELVTTVLMPQFRDRPWAWLAMESSTAKVPDCDFNREFREDAKLRGTYRLMTIRGNTSLTEEEIAREERRSGGKDSPGCRRELYCEEIRDEETMIIPEFDEAVHVVEPENWPMPRYALAYTGLDPGVTDPCGLVWFYFDWSLQVVVIQAAWQRSNASTGEVAEVVRETERELWGTEHRMGGRERVRELTIADAEHLDTGHVWTPPPGALTRWDANAYSLLANPAGRVSDVANRFILDLNKDYGMSVRKAEKSPGSAEADTEYLRTMFRERTAAGLPRVVILKNGRTQNIIEQLRSGTWNTDENGHRTDWARSKVLGHCDCLAALKYAIRDISENRNPNRPALVDPHPANNHVPVSIEEQAKRARPDPRGSVPRHMAFTRKTRTGFR